jgi:ribosomal protein S6--L-glutamate ligase
MIVSFHPCLDADVQIILGDRRLNPQNHREIGKAKAILLPQTCSRELYEACSRASALLFPDYRVRFDYPGKVGQALLFRNLNCQHPRTRIWRSVQEFREGWKRAGILPHDLPFFLKADRKHEAEGVYFITDLQTLQSALEHLLVLEASGCPGFISQEYIPAGANVLRAVILGRRLIAYWKRPLESGQVVTTISRGARIDHRWRPDLKEKGTREAQRLAAATGINLAALDFMFTLKKPDTCPLLLEVNHYFGRRGLGGSVNYYRLLLEAVRDWLKCHSLDPDSVRLV